MCVCIHTYCTLLASPTILVVKEEREREKERERERRREREREGRAREIRREKQIAHVRAYTRERVRWEQECASKRENVRACVRNARHSMSHHNVTNWLGRQSVTNSLSLLMTDRMPLTASHVSLSVLQCVAVCCSVLQCVAVCCSALQCVAVCCSALQCVAVCCSVLQCVAVRCSVLQCLAMCCRD